MNREELRKVAEVENRFDGNPKVYIYHIQKGKFWKGLICKYKEHIWVYHDYETWKCLYCDSLGN